MTNKTSDIQLVVTAALKKEIPKEWFESRGVAVHTLSALKSGALKKHTGFSTGILLVITGAGPAASEEAACWIRDNLKPYFVLNIGACGLNGKRYSTGSWFSPLHASDENGTTVEIDKREPVPYPSDTVDVPSLMSVSKPYSGGLPGPLKKHDVIDMECFAQANIFRGTGISFHCLKFSTDYSDSGLKDDFNRNVALLREEIKKLSDFLEAGQRTFKITAVIPVYNREHPVARAIDSVLAQSYPPDEIIVVDDCSTDRTPEILKRYGDKIRVLRMETNSGPSAARNEAVKHAGTDWLAFLDSDDCWEKDKLRGQVEYLTKYPFYRIMQSEEKWIRNGKRVNPCRHHKKPCGWIWEQSLERCLVSPSGVLVQKSLLEAYGGFDEDLPVCEDYDLWLKISRNHPVGLEQSMSVVKYGGHGDQLSTSYPAMDRFRVKSLAAQLEKETHPDFRRKLIHVLGKKLTILIKGCDKRGKDSDAFYYGEMLKTINKFQ
ncbi:MAG: glycosyltransferase [Nitrospirota bacterium]